MARQITGWWDQQKQQWMARLGPISSRTGKPKAVALRYANGDPVAKADALGASEAINRIRRERGRAEQAADDPTVADVCRAYVAWQAANGASQRTVSGHHSQLNRFCKIVSGGKRYADRKASSITPEDLWRADELGLGSLRLLYMSVLACWRWAHRPVKGRTPTRWLAANPLAGIARPTAGGRGDCVVPWPVVRRLLRFGRAWAKTPVATRRARTKIGRRRRVLCLTLIAYTGCRPFEAAELEWSEIDEKVGVIVVGPERDKNRRPGRKPRKPRVIAPPARLLQAISLLRTDGHDGGRWVFAPDWLENGLTAQEMTRWFREDFLAAASAAGVTWPQEATLYALRHSFATEGYDELEGQRAAATLGHSVQVGESVYHHRRIRKIKADAEKIRKARRKTAEES